MKISTLRESITGSEKNCRNKYVHETRSGKRYLDSGIDFVQGWCVFEGTPSYDEHWMYGCKGFTVGEFMQAVEDGLIKTELTDETKEKLREFENYGLGISVLLYCFPDDFDLPFKFCHRLLWSDEWEFGGDIKDCVYYFHNTGRDDYTRSANNCKPMHLKMNRLKTIDMNSNDGVKSTDKMLSAGIPLDPIFTFDNYVVGENNRFAVEAAKLIADSRSTVYTPLFIYGNHGLGKTHLAQAIGNRITEKNPDTKVIYTRSIKFIDDFIEALRNNTMPVFRSKYGSADVLIVEDVQYFQNI
jgi:chromosomal replication initiation ATPase DnaA